MLSAITPIATVRVTAAATARQVCVQDVMHELAAIGNAISKKHPLKSVLAGLKPLPTAVAPKDAAHARHEIRCCGGMQSTGARSRSH